MFTPSPSKQDSLDFVSCVVCISASDCSVITQVKGHAELMRISPKKKKHHLYSSRFATHL